MLAIEMLVMWPKNSVDFIEPRNKRVAPVSSANLLYNALCPEVRCQRVRDKEL